MKIKKFLLDIEASSSIFITIIEIMSIRGIMAVKIKVQRSFFDSSINNYVIPNEETMCKNKIQFKTVK